MVEKIIIEIGLLIITGIILAYASKYDIKHHKIEMLTVIYILLLGFIFYIITETDITTLIYSEIVITMIYLIPALLGMGFGDMLLFWGLGFFLADQNLLHMFLLGFFISAIIITIYYIDKYGLWKKKNRLQSIEFPLVPAILTGFIFFSVYYILQGQIF